MKKTKKTQCFHDRKEYEDALELFKEIHPEHHYIDNNDYENLIEGVTFFIANPYTDCSDVYNIIFKMAKGKAETIVYNTMDEWLGVITSQKSLYPTQCLIPADSAKKLEIGFLSVASKKIMRIRLCDFRKTLSTRHGELAELLRTIEGRILFGKQGVICE